ncbi:MAG: hypothetical protein K5851_01370 [Lachnospiraceae bacterium]|nr:hypothetical protein [Lachnospiraceae bacterium]
MGSLSKDELLSGLTNLISSKATATVNDVIRSYQDKHPDVEIEPELREEVLEQAISNLTFQSGHLRISSISSSDNLTERFNNWFEEDAKSSLVHTINIILDPPKKVH